MMSSGFMPMAEAIWAEMGRRMLAAAVLEINSVRREVVAVIRTTMAAGLSGLRAVRLEPSHAAMHAFSAPSASAKPPPT